MPLLDPHLLSGPQESLSASSAPCSGDWRKSPRCEEGVGSVHSLQLVNNCGFGNPSLIQSNGQTLSGSSANNSGTLVEGLAFLDQGSCGSTPNLSCTFIEIKLGGESNASYIRMLQTPFSVPVSFVYALLSRVFLLRSMYADLVYPYTLDATDPETGLNQTCRPQILECRAPDRCCDILPEAFEFGPPTIHDTLNLLHHHPLPLAFFTEGRAKRANSWGAELGGTIGGATLLLFLVIGFIYLLRRRRERLIEEFEARLPQRQEPFVVNPTWVLGSPTTPEGAAQSHLSLPDRARPRTVVPFTHQMSLPNLSTTQQYRTRVLRPRASTVGSGSVLARTEDSREQSQADAMVPDVAPTPSESSVWRPRIDILAARQQRTEVSGPAPPPIPMQSFWAE
ncbi:hypothetical protein MVEN_01452200 [Mycena venus]|uniref:Uncharacterized protein n=1 Tax=Mycena venus TaxID=2733690 RepID=A0A8H7CTM0_9AGAR|nr:hypothetical protein MVEN_01452200 [Mycena venus]